MRERRAYLHSPAAIKFSNLSRSLYALQVRTSKMPDGRDFPSAKTRAGLMIARLRGLRCAARRHEDVAGTTPLKPNGSFDSAAISPLREIYCERRETPGGSRPATRYTSENPAKYMQRPISRELSGLRGGGRVSRASSNSVLFRYHAFIQRILRFARGRWRTFL